MPECFPACSNLLIKSSNTVWFLLLLVMPVVVLEANEKALEATDFAYSLPLNEGSSSLREVLLPAEAHLQMKRPDFGDLRVFNADGQAVPHLLKRHDKRLTTVQKTLTFYPLSRATKEDPSQLRVIIERNSDRQKVLIDQQGSASDKPVVNQTADSDGGVENEPATHFIIDNRSADNQTISDQVERKQTNHALCKLKLDWQQTRPSMIIRLMLEGSDDLKSWRRIGSTYTVSNLRYAGSELRQQEVSVPCTRHHYLRLTWLDDKRNVRLTGLSGFYRENGESPVQKSVLGKPVIDKEGNWQFETNGAIPVMQLELLFAQTGMMVEGRLYSRQEQNTHWRFRKKLLQYRLLATTRLDQTAVTQQGIVDLPIVTPVDSVSDDEHDAKLVSDPAELNEITDRFWKLETTKKRLIREEQLPDIRITWQPYTVYFLAQGKGPYQIALGNETVRPSADGGLSSLLNRQKNKLVPEKVGHETLVRTSQFVAGSSLPWKKIIIWLLLLSGTALLAFMAYSLYRQMNLTETE